VQIVERSSFWNKRQSKSIEEQVSYMGTLSAGSVSTVPKRGALGAGLSGVNRPRK